MNGMSSEQGGRLLCELFLPPRYQPDLNAISEQFDDCAIKPATVVLTELLDVPAEGAPERRRAMLNNCRAVTTTIQIWQVPSLLMLDYRNARWEAA